VSIWEEDDKKSRNQKWEGQLSKRNLPARPTSCIFVALAEHDRELAGAIAEGTARMAMLAGLVEPRLMTRSVGGTYLT
jgi:hypothetical protein